MGSRHLIQAKLFRPGSKPIPPETSNHNDIPWKNYSQPLVTKDYFAFDLAFSIAARRFGRSSMSVSRRMR